MTAVHVIGWFGVLMVLGAYLFVSLGKIRPDGRIFHIINLLGGIALGVIAIATHNWPQLVVEIVWCVTAVYFLSKVFLKD